VTGFISLSGPWGLSGTSNLPVPPGGVLSLTDPGQSAFYLLGGPTAFGSTAAAAFKHLSAYDGVVNVRHYGALGNGTADDASAIQAALDTGKTVYFPPATYAVGTALTIATGGTVVDAWGATLRKIAGVDALTINLSADRCTVNGLTINGQGSAGAGLVVGSNRNEVWGVRALMNNDGIVVFGQATNPGADVNVLEGCEVGWNTGSGLYLRNATDCYVSNLLSQANGVHGILIETTGYSCKIVNSVIDSNARRAGQDGHNVTVRQADAFLVANSVVTNCNNGGDGIRFDSGPVSQNGFGVVNCDLAQNGAHGVRIRASAGNVTNRVRVIGNRINGNASGSVLIDAGCSANFLIGNDFSGTYPTDNGTATIIAYNDVPLMTAGASGTAGVSSLNTLTGALTILAGQNITTAFVGTTAIQINASLTAAGTGSTSVSAGWWNTFPYLTPPSTADTIWVNQGDATLTVLTAVEVAHQTAGLFLLAPLVAAGALQLRIRLMPKPTAAAWTATMAFQPYWRGVQFPEMGFILGNTAAGAGNLYQSFHLLQNNGGVAIEVVNYAGVTTFGAPAVPFTENYAHRPGLYFLRLRETTGTINYEQMVDGRDWQYMTGWSTTTYLSGYNQIGYFVASRNAAVGAGMTLWSWTTAQ
jgi:hypothetical protein